MRVDVAGGVLDDGADAEGDSAGDDDSVHAGAADPDAVTELHVVHGVPVGDASRHLGGGREQTPRMLIDHRLVGCLEVLGDAHDLAAARDAEGMVGVVETRLPPEGLLIAVGFAVGDTNVWDIGEIGSRVGRGSRPARRRRRRLGAAAAGAATAPPDTSHSGRTTAPRSRWRPACR